MLPSHLQCPGQLLSFADDRGLPWLVHHQEQTAGGRRPWVLSARDRARAESDLRDVLDALESLARQLPDGAEVLPSERITSAEGRRILASEPRRFSRIRLGSRKQVFVDLFEALKAAIPPRAADRDRSLDGLFAQLLAHPDDDEPRLVFADAISATDPEYGEFITLQVQLRARARRGEPIPTEHEKLVAAHLSQYGDRWSNGLASLVPRYEFRGGFVEFVDLPAKDYPARADEIFSVAPIRHLRLTLIDEGLEAALAHPTMQRVQVLSLAGSGSLDALHAPLESVRVLDLSMARGALPRLPWPRLEQVLHALRSPSELALY